MMRSALPLFMLFVRASVASVSPPAVAAGWWTAWHAQQFPISAIPWDKYSTMIYSFIHTTPDLRVLDFDQGLLRNFVTTAHSNNVNALASIGGWGGGQYLSSSMATAANRTIFAQTVIKFCSQYQLDGFEVDWEWPTKNGPGINTVSPDDSNNFLLWLQTVRSLPGGEDIIITAATKDTPFLTPSGSPMKDVSAFAKVLDYIEIMNYEIFGPWYKNVGPNAPLRDSCTSVDKEQGSAESAVKVWSAAGFPTNRMILGVAGFGRAYSVPLANGVYSNGKMAYYPLWNATLGDDSWDGSNGLTGSCGLYSGEGSGLISFWGMVKCGFLTQDGLTAPGLLHRYDACSSTPYIYDMKRQIMVSYDDEQSFTDKGRFINNRGLAGYAMWEVGGDYNNQLVNAMNKAIGINFMC